MTLSVQEELMHNTIRIEILDINQQTISSGTGFFFNFELNDKMRAPVLVTNKHVIKDAKIGKIIFTEKENNKPLYGNRFDYIIEGFEEAFIKHPDEDIDLCIMPLMQVHNDAYAKYKKELFTISLTENLIPNQDKLSKLSVLEDIIMLGYPNGLWDAVNNLPLIRKGITAIHPKFDYNGKTDIVMDIASFPGSSGSPVFVYNQGSYSDGNDTIYENRIIFLGILYSGPIKSSIGRIANQEISTALIPVSVTDTMLNLGYAVKSSRLLDFKPILNKIYEIEKQKLNL